MTSLKISNKFPESLLESVVSMPEDIIEAPELKLYNYKGITHVRSKVKTCDTYTESMFINFRWSDIQLRFTIVCELDYFFDVMEILESEGSTISKEQNLNEYVFTRFKDKEYIIAIFSNRIRNPHNEDLTITSKLHLNNKKYPISSDDILELFRSMCIYCHTPAPSSNIDLSYTQDGLLLLTYKGLDAKK